MFQAATVGRSAGWVSHNFQQCTPERLDVWLYLFPSLLLCQSLCGEPALLRADRRQMAKDTILWANHFWPIKIQERNFKLQVKEFQGHRCLDGYLDLFTPKIQYKIPSFLDLSFLITPTATTPRPIAPLLSYNNYNIQSYIPRL